jgi:hypothetical protein
MDVRIDQRVSRNRQCLLISNRRLTRLGQRRVLYLLGLTQASKESGNLLFQISPMNQKSLAFSHQALY